jgi:hypothetical protein
MAKPLRGAQHASRSRVPFGVVVVAISIVVAGAVLWRWNAEHGVRAEPSPIAHPPPRVSASASPSASPSITPSPSASRTPGPINTTFAGITTFRGNASRSYYGEGPVPRHPRILWRYPTSGGLCSSSSVGSDTKLWCGTGWTGQPNVIVGKDPSIEIRIGAYDGQYQFLDCMTGDP